MGCAPKVSTFLHAAEFSKTIACRGGVKKPPTRVGGLQIKRYCVVSVWSERALLWSGCGTLLRSLSRGEGHHSNNRRPRSGGAEAQEAALSRLNKPSLEPLARKVELLHGLAFDTHAALGDQPAGLARRPEPEALDE